MEGLHSILESIPQLEHRAMLATIIRVEGHAYRKEGAVMLLAENGTAVGHISPGCLEADLMERVPRVVAHEQTEVVEYDMRPPDDLSWGENIGCGGCIRVLLEPLTVQRKHQLAALKQRLDRGERVRRMCTLADGTTFIFEYTPKPRLILFGAGSDAKAVAELAHRVGFRVVVTDWRPAYCSQENFPAADRLIPGFPKEAVKEIQFSKEDYIIVMSHHFPRDQEFLRLMLVNQVKYVGILGSKTRTERLLEGMNGLQAIHYPVGLAIGAQGPEEIAVSVMAQLIQVKRQADLTEKRKGANEKENSRFIFSSGKKQ